MQYNKLVRDKIPEIIASHGGVAVTHIADDEEYRDKLREKLEEEVKEYLEDESIEELADILEVIHALAAIHGVSPEDLEHARKKKAEKRGAFKSHIILDES
jgi:predicted house-cleaning noncanonical NTP pyrophosphatase (MazG superfamily)